jgi:hypothetical protein
MRQGLRSAPARTARWRESGDVWPRFAGRYVVHGGRMKSNQGANLRQGDAFGPQPSNHANASLIHFCVWVILPKGKGIVEAAAFAPHI